MIPDYTDFYIKSPEVGGSYNDTELIEDDIIKVIVQKYLVLLYTKKGDVYGNPEMGCDIEDLVYTTSINETSLLDRINEQIFFFIPELAQMNYDLNVQFVKDDMNYKDVLFIHFTINDYDVYNIIHDGNI